MCEIFIICLFFRLSENAQLLKNMFGMSGRNGSQEQNDVLLSEDPGTSSGRRGYAFSQEEGGVVTQSQLIRQYNTSVPKPKDR